MQEENKLQEETVEEKKARVLEKMKRHQTGTMTKPKKTAADHNKINEYYGKKVEEYTDGMTLEKMKDVDMNTLKGTDFFAFRDALMFKLSEEAKEVEDASVIDGMDQEVNS